MPTIATTTVSSPAAAVVARSFGDAGSWHQPCPTAAMPKATRVRSTVPTVDGNHELFITRRPKESASP